MRQKAIFLQKSTDARSKVSGVKEILQKRLFPFEQANKLSDVEVLFETGKIEFRKKNKEVE